MINPKVPCPLCSFAGSTFGSMIVHFGNNHHMRMDVCPRESEWPAPVAEAPTLLERMAQANAAGINPPGELKAALGLAHMEAAKNQIGLVADVMETADYTTENIEAYRAALKEADLQLATAHAMLKAAA